MRRGDVEKSIEIEQRLSAVRKSDLAIRYLAMFRSLRLAWEGRFSEAHQLVASAWAHLPFNFDRIVSGSEYALFLALDARSEESVSVTREILSVLASSTVTGLFRVRAMAIARIICALVEAINGRVTYADRVLRAVKSNGDLVISLAVTIADSMLARQRHRGESGADRIRDSVERLAALGYADLAFLMRAVDHVLSYGQTEALGQIDLTPSEIDVLRLLAEGFAPKEIAARNERSVHTVRVHIANSIAKLGCHGLAQAIREAHRLGLI
jgi:DNA-binding CsgD family transcriptional regulator